jgi:hypothetical protein
MKILVACEFSGIVREAFARRGHDTWSCDLLPTEIPGNHIQDDVLRHLRNGWELMIAFPPCTYLANSGVRWLINNPFRMTEMEKAAWFFNRLLCAPIDKIAIENPIQHKYARALIRKYNQIIQPYEFGHGETKATCLWIEGLPLLEPTNKVKGREGRVWKETPSLERWKNRSRTYQGIAEAMAEQWG